MDIEIDATRQLFSMVAPDAPTKETREFEMDDEIDATRQLFSSGTPVFSLKNHEDFDMNEFIPWEAVCDEMKLIDFSEFDCNSKQLFNTPETILTKVMNTPETKMVKLSDSSEQMKKKGRRLFDKNTKTVVDDYVVRRIVF